MKARTKERSQNLKIERVEGIDKNVIEKQKNTENAFLDIDSFSLSLFFSPFYNLHYFYFILLKF